MLKKPDYGKDEENNLTLLGFLCFKDPLKSTAKESIDQFRKLGVEVNIMTGDNPTVAKTIVKEAGIEAREIPVGENITAMDDVQLEKAAEKARAMQRMSRAVCKFRKVFAIRSSSFLRELQHSDRNQQSVG